MQEVLTICGTLTLAVYVPVSALRGLSYKSIHVLTCGSAPSAAAIYPVCVCKIES